MKTKPTKSFADCSFHELCRFKKDGVDIGDVRIGTDSDTVWITEQKLGHPPKKYIEVPRGLFNKLVAEYLKQRSFVRK